MRCVLCGRPLGGSVIDLPIGRVCKRKLLSVDLTDAKPFQVDKALDLIVDRGIVRIRTRFTLPTFKVASSDGSTTYLTAPSACTCPAGLATRLCYHRLAVRMLTA